jgi:hypothetical protein
MTRGPALTHITEWLRRVVEPDSVIDLRTLGRLDDPKYTPFTVAGYFDYDHLAELVRAAMGSTRKAAGCHRVVKRPRQSTANADIVRRVALVFDADPVRPTGISAAAQEKAPARERIDRIVSSLAERGWPVIRLITTTRLVQIGGT